MTCFLFAATILFAAPCCAGGAELVNSLGMKLVRIEPGTFRMGQDGPPADYHMTRHPAEFDHADWDEKPAHPVRITQPFYIGVTEVTVGQYRQFEPKFRQTKWADDEAVREVSWHDAVAFCDWLSKKEGRTYRLATEAEWEYACRAGTTTLFHTGDALPAGFQKWFREENRRFLYFTGPTMPPEYRHLPGIPTAKVAQSVPNAWGLYDMHGNVAEWCADWYGPYEAGEQVDPLVRSAGDFRVFRGGAHSSFSGLLRSANRAAWIPESRHPSIGFRVVMGERPKGKSLPPPSPPANARNVEQRVASIAPSPADAPFFRGPTVFVHIPPNSHGPLFSWHNHSPAIAECPNGDLLAAWFSCVDEGGTELCTLASRLRCNATQWEAASPFWDGADINDHAPKLWWDGNHTLFHFSRGLSENTLRSSTDNGATWSKARVLFPIGEFGNQLIRLRNGTLAITHDSRTTSLVTSADGGQTWDAVQLPQREKDIRPGGKGQHPPGIHAPIVELRDGRLMAFSRQDPVEDQARFHGKMPVSYSSDGGKTWIFHESEFPAISSAQRAVLIRLQEGPLLLCSFTDQGLHWRNRKGLSFKAADGSQFTGYGLFAAVSYDEGNTWPDRRVVTPGGASRILPGIDRAQVEFNDTMSEPTGYLAVIQTRDGRIQLLSSKNHYVFNLAWLKQRPPLPPSPTPDKAPGSARCADLWPADRPYPPPQELSFPEGLQRVLVEPPNDQYRFLHDPAIAVHKGALVAGWYNCPEKEMIGESLIRARRSHDGGKTWSSPEVVAADREKEGTLFVPVNFLSHQGTLYAFVGIMKGGPDRIRSTRAYAWDEVRKVWISKGEIADLFLDNTAPVKMQNGNFIMAGRAAVKAGNLPTVAAVAISVGDNLPAPWKVVPLHPREAAVGSIPETSLLVRDDRLLALVRREQNASPAIFQSTDGGITWSEQFGHSFRAAPAKMYLGVLTTGQSFVLFNYPIQSGKNFSRRLLMLGVSRPGENTLAKLWKIQDASPGGPAAAHYPCAIEHDGKLLVVYTADYPRRRACELAIVPLVSLRDGLSPTQ